MKMIAFITIKSSLVPLIEGLCAQICFRFEISVVLLTSSSFFLVKKKSQKKTKRQLVQTSTCSPAYIYTCVLCTPHGRYICILSLQYIWISSELSRCLVATPGLTSKYPTCSVCVCAYTHTHNTYTSTPCKNWGDTSLAQTNLSHWKQTPIVDQLEKPRSPHFYIRMQCCPKHL